MFAFCSNRRPVTRATTPVWSRPITVMVANNFIVSICRVARRHGANSRGGAATILLGPRRAGGRSKFEWLGLLGSPFPPHPSPLPWGNGEAFGHFLRIRKHSGALAAHAEPTNNEHFSSNNRTHLNRLIRGDCGTKNARFS